MNMFWEVRSKLRFPTGWILAAIKKDKVASAGVGFIMMLLLLASFCYFIIPDRSYYANRVCRPIANQRPGFEVSFLKVMENRPEQAQDFFSKLVYGTRSNDFYIPLISSRYEGTDIVVKEFTAFNDSSFESRYNIADVVYALNPEKEIIERSNGLVFEKANGVTTVESINELQGFINGQYFFKTKFLLGTDHMGRDVLSRLIAATRATIFTALVATLISLILGFIFGLSIGILDGRTKTFISWLIHSIYSIPALVLIIVLMFTVGNGFWRVCLISGAILSLEVSRAIQNKIASNRELKFMETAYALGLTKLQVLRKHTLQGIFKPLFASSGTIFCGAILVESALSFMGLGFVEPFPSWGAMIRENFGYIIVPGYAYLTILPGLAITFVSFSFVILARKLHSIENDYYDWSLV